MIDTIDLTTIFGDALQHVDEDSRCAIEELPATAWPILEDGMTALNGGGDPGIDAKVATIRDTLDEWRAVRLTHWHRAGQLREETVAGRPALLIEGLQMYRGQTRTDLIIIDLGEQRVVMHLL